MSGVDATSNPLLTPAMPDAPAQPMAVVLTKQRKVVQGRNTYFVAAGTVTEVRTLPAKTTYQTPSDAELKPAIVNGVTVTAGQPYPT